MNILANKNSAGTAVRTKKKKAVANLKFKIKAGSATPAPPIGPALGQKGINIMEFCKAFNERSANYDKSYELRVLVEVYADKSYSFCIKMPEATWFIKRAVSLQKGSNNPGAVIVKKIHINDLREIANIKMQDMGVVDINSALHMLAGSARSMGIAVAFE